MPADARMAIYSASIDVVGRAMLIQGEEIGDDGIDLQTSVPERRRSVVKNVK